jgi:hypothetical protein
MPRSKQIPQFDSFDATTLGSTNGIKAPKATSVPLIDNTGKSSHSMSRD